MSVVGALELVGHAAVLLVGGGPVGTVGVGEWMTAISEGTGVGGANPINVVSYSQTGIFLHEQLHSCSLPNEYRAYSSQ